LILFELYHSQSIFAPQFLQVKREDFFTVSGFGPGTANLFRKMVGLSELSWADQQHLQKILQIRQQRESDQQISKSKIPSKKYTKKRQSSLTEFIE
jgi:hypothetical protein